MIIIPATATGTPVASQAIGRTPSTSQSHVGAGATESRRS